MATLVVAVGLILGVGWLVSARLETVRAGTSWVAHAEEVRFELAAVLQSLDDIGSGVTTYERTHDASAFANSDAAAAHLPVDLASLRRALAGEIQAKPLIDSLMMLATQRQNQASEVISEARAGEVKAVQAAQAAAMGRSLMIAIRAVVGQLQILEDAALKRHIDTAEQAYRVAIYTVLLSVFTAICLLLVITYASLRDGERLRESQQELAITLQSVGDAVISTDEAGTVRFMNEIAEQLTGWQTSAARGRPLTEIFQIVNEQTRAVEESPVDKVLREGKIVGLANHTVLVAKNGTERAIEDSGAPIRTAAGELKGVVLVFRDATAERATQRALRESEKRFRAAVDVVEGVLWTNTAAGEMRGEQPGWAALTGQSFDDYQGLGWAQAVHPDDAQPTIAAWNAAVAANRPFLFEHRVKRHDGQWRTFAIRAQPTLDEDGAIREWIGVHTDITERKLANIEQARLAAVAEQSRDFIGFMDVALNPVFVNPAGRQLVGLSGLEAVRKSRLIDYFAPDSQCIVNETVVLAVQGHGFWSGELQFQHFLTGTPIAVFYTLFRIRDSFGSLIGYGTVTRDLTDAKRVEAALREANVRKDVFLATLSHELRNPLAPIRNAATILSKATLSREDHERSRLIIVRQVRHMALLLDDLLDISRITRGVFALKKDVVNLQDLLAEALETVRPLIDQKRHTIHLEWPEAPIEVELDPIRFVQIAANLLTNAAKYTDSGGVITFGVQLTQANVTFFVRDTGIGLAPHMLDKVFEMFSQVAPDQKRSEGGLGIGLALVKGLVDLHGGRIEARSAGLERGCEFVVFLPDVLVNSTSVPDLPSASSEKVVPTVSRRVLIADDNRDGAESLAMLVELAGHQVFIAHTGTDALKEAATRRPHVAILDIGMPGMDGYEVAEQIREQTWGTHMILIALTGWGQEDDRRRAQRAGFDHHLTKPVDPAALKQLLDSPPA